MDCTERKVIKNCKDGKDLRLSRKEEPCSFEHICRMDPARLTMQRVRFFESRKTTVHWHHEVKEDVEEMGIQGTEVSNREAFQSRIKNVKPFQKKIGSCIQTLWQKRKGEQRVKKWGSIGHRTKPRNRCNWIMCFMVGPNERKKLY